MQVAWPASHGGLPHRKTTHYKKAVLRIKDGFPKLKDDSKESGGSGISVTNSAGKVSVWHGFKAS